MNGRAYEGQHGWTTHCASHAKRRSLARFTHQGQQCGRLRNAQQQHQNSRTNRSVPNITPTTEGTKAKPNQATVVSKSTV